MTSWLPEGWASPSLPPPSCPAACSDARPPLRKCLLTTPAGDGDHTSAPGGASGSVGRANSDVIGEHGTELLRRRAQSSYLMP